jgi:hypothetical protein
MQFTHEMILQSDSGYCMPFEEKNKDVEDVARIWQAEAS